MKAREGAAWLALLGASCALPALRVDEDLDDDTPLVDGDDAVGGNGGGGASTGGGGKGGSLQGGASGNGGATPIGGGPTGGKGGSAGTPTGGKGGTDAGGDGGSNSGGSATGGKGGSAGTPTGGKGGTTGGSAGSATGGKSGAAGQAGMSSGGGGVGGAPCGSTVATSGDASIDDLESGMTGIKLPRVGYWYTFNDGQCSPAQLPAMFAPEAGAGHGMYAARTTGGPCSVWGAGIGFSLASCGGNSDAYDASVFNGLTFWYKSTTAVRMSIATVPVIPTTRGGTCVPGGTGMECDNAHGANLAAAPAGTTVSIAFAVLTQDYGQMKPFDKTELVNVAWQVVNGLAFDFTVDDIAFTP